MDAFVTEAIVGKSRTFPLTSTLINAIMSMILWKQFIPLRKYKEVYYE